MLGRGGIRAGDVVQRALKNDNVRIASGQDALKDTAIRIVHMGPVRPDMLLRGVKALARALAELGMDAKLAQAGFDTAPRVLRRSDQKTAAR